MNATGALSRPRSAWPALAWLLVSAGALALGIELAADPAEAFASLLSSAIFTLALALGGGIFIATQGAAGATWWLPIARVPLLLLRTLPVPAAAILVVLALGLDTLYPWARPDEVAASPILQAKMGWLNPPFFLSRAIVVLLVWLGLAGAFRRRLGEGAPAVRRISILFLAALAPTLSIAAWDWAMSLEPEWYSTMYAVTLFSSAFASGIAGVIVVGLALEGTSAAPRGMSASLRHDLGKLLFAFSCFWAYVWFCEYLLIWYANLPEEATHFVSRTTSGWGPLFWLQGVLAFVVPFVVLMPVATKRSPATLLHVSVAVLAGHWLGAFLRVHPVLGPFPGFPVTSVLVTGALLGAMGLVGKRILDREGS